MPVTSLGVVASGTYVGGAGTLTLPFASNIPRSDPSTGATLIFWWATTSFPVGSSNASFTVSDDGAPDAFYGDCYFTNQLNQYSGPPPGGAAYNRGGNPSGVTVDFNKPLASPAGVYPSYGFGCVFNPLTTSNNLILTITGTGPVAINVFAVAYTGVAFVNGGHIVDTPLGFWDLFQTSGGFYGEFTDIPDSRTSPLSEWAYNESVTHGQPYNSGPVGPPFIRAPWLPGTTVYPDWEINGPGDLIVYTLADMNHGGAWPGSGFPGSGAPYGDYDTGSSGGWTWGSGSITTVYEFDDYDGNSDGMLASFVYAEQPLGGAAPITGQDITGSWAGITPTYTTAGAFTMFSGAGPPQCGGPPPTFNGPVFNHVHRAGD